MKKRKNAGAGYGYMFHGAFKEKKDAVAKERKTKGAWIQSGMTQQGFRYFVMSPRTNPIKRKKKPAENPTELLVMGANPHGQEHSITLPPNSTITIRTNPEPAPRENWMGAERERIAAGQRARSSRAFERQAKARRKATRAGEAEADRFYTDLRKRSRGSARGARKVFHELFSRDNPICGAHIGGGELCTRKPRHKGPHLPQGATLRPKSRKPRGNPSAAALRSTFTGADPDTVSVYDEPHMPAGDYAQLGELLALYAKPREGGQVQQITFPRGARPLLVADETARQLYFVGGDQNLTRSLEAFGIRDRGGSIFELGEARRIDYKQRKEHVPHPEADEWRHEFGEETDVRPTLLYDANRRRLLLEGGEYQIRAEGIVN